MSSIGQSFRDLLDTVIQFVPKLVGFLLILVIGYFIAKALQKEIAVSDVGDYYGQSQ
jgi:putative Mn2+ efflux pump MntP